MSQRTAHRAASARLPRVTGRDLFWAGGGVATLCVQLPIVKMILDDPQVLSLVSWHAASFTLFSVLTFLALPLVCGWFFQALWRVKARMGEVALVGVTCYLIAMQVHFHYLLFYHTAAPWRRPALLALLLVLFGILWRWRRPAIDMLKVCTVFGVGIFVYFAYAAAPYKLARFAAATPTITKSVDVPPVFFFTFEKLLASYVTDQRGRIEADTYPHLAEFVAGADHYVNAYANSAATTYSLKTLYTGRLLTTDKNWSRHPNLRDILGADRRAVMLLDTATLSYCQSPQDTCVGSIGTEHARGFDLIAGWYKAYVYTILPGRVATVLGQRGWTFDPRNTLWSWEIAALQPGEEPHVNVGRRQFRTLNQTIQQEGQAAHLYIMHNFITDRPGTKTYARTRIDPRLQGPGLPGRDLRDFDRALGTFLETLKALGIYKRSLIVLTSDTGDDPALVRTKGEQELPVSDAMAHIFLAIKRPDQRSGRILRAVMRQIDVLPTVLKDLGIDPTPYAFQGEPVTDPQDRATLAQRPLELVIPTHAAGLIHYELTEASGPFRRLDKRGAVLHW